MKPIFITSTVNPDLDGVACCVAYAELQQKLGQETVIGLVGEMTAETKFVLEHFNLALPDCSYNPEDFGRIILVDASYIWGLDSRIKPEQAIEVIDHRSDNDSQLFVNAKIQIETVGACATLVAEKFQQNQKEISAMSAILLCTGIISNTLNFQAHITSPRDKDMASWLNQQRPLPANFAWQMFGAKSDFSGDKLTAAIEQDFKSGGLGKLGISQIEMIGGDELAQERQAEITAKLRQKQQEFGLEDIFLSIVELKEGHNIFVTGDPKTQDLLKSVFGVTFENNIAILPDLLMRKEIRPLLKKALGK